MDTKAARDITGRGRSGDVWERWGAQAGEAAGELGPQRRPDPLESRKGSRRAAQEGPWMAVQLWTKAHKAVEPVC